MHSRAVALLWISLVSACFAQSNSEPKSDETDQPELVARVLALCRTGMGDVDPQALLTIRAQGSLLSYDGSNSPITWKIAGHNSRLDIQRPTGAVLAIVGPQGSHVDIAGLRKKLRFTEAAHFKPEFIPALACSSAESATPRIVRYAGQEQFDARTVIHLHLWQDTQSKHKAADAVLTDQHLFVDANSGEVLRLRNFSFSPESLGNRSIWEVRYSDFRIIDGLKIPFRLERYLDGQWHSTIQLTTLDFHAANSPADFE